MNDPHKTKFKCGKSKLIWPIKIDSVEIKCVFMYKKLILRAKIYVSDREEVKNSIACSCRSLQIRVGESAHLLLTHYI